jgi:hypothetical protein
MRMASFNDGASSSRDRVGWEQRPTPLFGNPAASKLEGRVGAQEVEVDGVLVAGGDGEDARADHVGDRMCNAQGIVAVGKAPGQPLGDAQPRLG